MDQIVVEQEIGKLKKTTDRQERKKEKLPSLEGLILSVDDACKLAAELWKEQERWDLIKRRTKAQKRKLGESIWDGIVKKEAKRLPKRCYDEVEAELGAGVYTRRIRLAEGLTDNEDAIRIEHLK